MVRSAARAAVALLVVATVSSAHAQGAVPLDVQAKLLLKIASYDRNLPADELGVAVVHSTRDNDGGAAILSALGAIGNLRVSGRAFSAFGVAAASAQDVETKTRARPVYA